MPTNSIAAPAEAASLVLVPIADSDGRTWYAPEAALDALRLRGIASLDVHLVITANADAPKWLTVTECACLHAGDMPEHDTCDAVNIAKSRISRACTHGELRSVGKGLDRRIDPADFDAWRKRRVERDCDRIDAGIIRARKHR